MDMTKPTENELFEQWAIDYGLDWESNFTRLDVETAWLSRAELADKEKAELQAQVNELQNLIDETIEKCAKICDEAIDKESANWIVAHSFAEAIRALKGKQNEPTINRL